MPNCRPASEALPNIYDAFADAIEHQDSAALAAFYGAYAKVVAPGSDIVSGVEGIPAYFDALFDFGVKRCSFEILDIDQRGDVAIEIGRVTLYAADDTEIDTLKYLVVWICENGKWLVHRDILTSDKPVA